MFNFGKQISRLESRIKLAVGTKVLDVVEKLPSFNGGFVEHLQEMRRFERKQVEPDFANTRLPDGGRLELPKLMMFQVYPIEDLDILTRAMEKTFGNDKYRRSADSLEDVKKSESKLWAGSWSFLGHLSRDKSSFYYPRGHRYVKNLPTEISRIGIDLYKVFPSTFVMLFSVSLTDAVSDTLNALHNKRYLGKIEFRHFLPLWRWAYGSSHGFGDSMRATEISIYLDKVAYAAERVIKSFFPEPRISRKRRLPILRDLRLILPIGSDASLKDGKIFRWGGSLGLHSLSFDSYRDGDTSFSFSRSEDDGEKLWTIFTSHSGSFTDDEDRHLDQKASSLIPMLAIRDLLHHVGQEIGFLRVKAYRRVVRPRRVRGFRRDLRLYARLQVQKFIAGRIKTERKADPHAFSLWSASLSQFKHCTDAGSNLFSVLNSGFNGMEALISQHSQLVVGLFQSYVEARNLEVSYRLSRRVLLWTVLVTILTVTSCLASYNQSVEQAKKMRDYIRQHIASASRH